MSRMTMSRTNLKWLAVCTVAISTGVVLVHYAFQSMAAKRAMTTPMNTVASSSLKLVSPAFNDGAPIPVRYTCDGQEISPPLVISGAPAGSESLVLIVEDPDTSVGVFTHWVVFNVPPDTREVHESMPRTSATFGLPGTNSAGTTDYLGPCPPSGTHRYFFRLYALDTMLALLPGASKGDILHAMEGHVIGESDLMGTYGR